MPDDPQGELDVTAPGGFGFRSKGYRVMDLVCLLTAAGVVAGAYYVRGYAAEYENNAKAVTQSNEKVVQALRENNEKTNAALEKLNDRQRQSNDVMREIACLLDPALKNRQDARDVCKRLARDRDIR